MSADTPAPLSMQDTVQDAQKAETTRTVVVSVLTASMGIVAYVVSQWLLTEQRNGTVAAFVGLSCVIALAGGCMTWLLLAPRHIQVRVHGQALPSVQAVSRLRWQDLLAICGLLIVGVLLISSVEVQLLAQATATQRILMRQQRTQQILLANQAKIVALAATSAQSVDPASPYRQSIDAGLCAILRDVRAIVGARGRDLDLEAMPPGFVRLARLGSCFVVLDLPPPPPPLGVRR
jgi:hypothetical protein